jgi:hypothetical protein
MRKKHTRHPHVGPQFDSHQQNAADNVRSYCNTLEYYRPRGFSALVREGRAIARKLDKDNSGETFECEWMDEADTLLTEWARRVVRHDYIAFGQSQHTGDVGFYYLADAAMENADLRIDAGDAVPRGFSGTVAEVTDHGNVTLSVYSRGRRRELFACV